MLDLLVIQLTPFCNINCRYCYLNDRNNNKRIQVETIHKIIDRLEEDDLVSSPFTIVFHAGEPLVVKPEFLEQILITFSNRLPNLKINYSIQTNGTLISQKWCDLIKTFNIQIGISIDGPAFINDENRKTRNGKGTFEAVLAGINLLQKNHLQYHGIAVVSESSINYPEEIFNFFHSNGFHQLGLNIEEMEGVNKVSSVFKGKLERKIVDFYKAIYSLYLKSDRRMQIREFENALNCILRDPKSIDIRLSKITSHQLIPFAIISVDYQGNFSTFSPELIGQDNESYNNFILGNVYDSSFKKNHLQALVKTLEREINAGIKMCKSTCSYYHVCGGGAPANKLYENNTFQSTETKYCKYSIQTPVDVVLESLERMTG